MTNYVKIWADMMNDKYHLKTGESGESQLDNLDRIFGESSREFLTHIGVKPNMRVLDVGCGIGNLSLWLAEQVGPNGKVIGVDQDAKQLEVAQNRAHEKSITNVFFQQADAHDLAEFNDQFDLTYCRWLLSHVKNPADVVNSMANTVRLNGLLACEVGDMRTTFYYPEFPAYNHFLEKIVELFKQTGNDTDIALNIYSIGKQLENFVFNSRVSQQVLHEPEKIKEYTLNNFFLVNSIAPSLIAHKLMTQQEVDQLKSELETFVIDESTLIYLTRMTQVWCKRIG